MHRTIATKLPERAAYLRGNLSVEQPPMYFTRRQCLARLSSGQSYVGVIPEANRDSANWKYGPHTSYVRKGALNLDPKHQSLNDTSHGPTFLKRSPKRQNPSTEVGIMSVYPGWPPINVRV